MNGRIWFSALCFLTSWANACGLRDNGATYIDPGTGLEIQKCAVGQTWTGGQCTGTASLHTFDQAVTRYRQGAWRLITKDEAEKVVNNSKGCTNFYDKPPGGVYPSWTSSGNSSIAWTVFFYQGYVPDRDRNGDQLVFLVRSRQSPGVAAALGSAVQRSGQTSTADAQNQSASSCESEVFSLCQQLKGDSRCINKSQFLEDGFKHYSGYTAAALQAAINNFRQLGLTDPGNKLNHCVAQESLARKNGVGSSIAVLNQSNQSGQQLTQQSQQLAQQNQARADQQRQGKRKTHNEAAQAHSCIEIDKEPGLFGAFKNTCEYKVNFYTCNYKPKIKEGGFNWSADFDCEKNQYGLHTPSGGVAVAAHNRNTEMVYWFACKAPAGPVDAVFVLGKGIEARCH